MFEAIAAFRRRLKEGQTLIGTGIALTDPQASEALADSFDFFWLDMEHSFMSPEALRAHLLVCRAKKVAALVRVAGGHTTLIKPVLDAGAPALVVPQISRVEQVRQAVADCRYPPRGRRGFGPLVPSNYGREGGPEYVERANAEVFVAVMIETTAAVEAIDEIVAVEGLDAVVIGPWDLSASLGVLGQVHHPSVVEAMEKIIAAAQKGGMSVGSGMPLDPEFALVQAKRGVQILQIGGDCGFLVHGARRLTAAMRQGLEK